jgi:HTH-type transcriptional regulator/antitoxin HigA
MSVVEQTINPQTYGKLLAKARPTVIKSEEENDRMLTLVERLMAKGDRLSPEEGRLLELLGKLIADFEEEFYQPTEAAAYEVLQELMQARGLKQSDLIEVFGSKSRVSEAVSGKRSISKSQAKALSEFFHLPADLFI